MEYETMPLIDMPLADLYKYQGINPKPLDHDAFWEAALQEMHDMDAKVELVPSQFQAPGAECFDLYFTGVRNARIHAKYLRPTRSQTPHPAVIMFHGYTQDSGDWSDKLRYVHLGFSVAALDCRGQGGFSEDPGGVSGNTHRGHIIRGLSDKPENLLYRQIFLDTAQLAGIVMAMPEVDEKRVGALGGSQGGGLTLACASLEPRIRKAAPTYPFLCDYQRVWELDLAKDAYDELRTYFRMFDPMHKNEKGIFTTLGYIDVQYLTPRIKADVLMGTGLMDTICPPSTQFAAYNKIKSPKRIIIYPDFGHEFINGFDDQVFLFMSEL
jgi:cephalosporin-C deacetylase